jgi:hypothetical protein
MFDLGHIVGRRVLELGFGASVTLGFWSEQDGQPHNRANLDASRVLYQSTDGRVIQLDVPVQDESEFAPLLSLQGAVVVAARASDEDGTLALDFDTGARLTALPLEAVEGWQVAGPDNHLVVAAAGGGVAVWD